MDDVSTMHFSVKPDVHVATNVVVTVASLDRACLFP